MLLLRTTTVAVDHRCCRERYEGFEGAPGAAKASHYMGSEFEDCENEDEARDRAIEVAMRDFLSGREEPKSFSGMSLPHCLSHTPCTSESQETDTETRDRL